MEPLNERKVYTVSELNREIRCLLESKFQNVWVKGEISNYRIPPSGHCYFTLKDESAQLKAVCFRITHSSLKFKLEDGLEVLARGRVTAYEPRGDYQIVVDHMEPVGLGSLQLAFEQLKEKLRKEGLFEPARKRPLPLLPCKIGIVTSPTGAVIRDILRILKRRNNKLNILIYPVKVQGDGAAAEIATGIVHLNTISDIEVLIVGRGGGSIEDLWSFNEEIVARAIGDSRIPVISAVGHEIDFTIADFVADLRAPTPSAAAELVSAAAEELQQRIAVQFNRLLRTASYLLEKRRAQLMLLNQSRGLSGFLDRIRSHAQRVDESIYRIGGAAKSQLAKSQNKFSIIADRLKRINLIDLVNKRRELLAYQMERLKDGADNFLARERKAFEIQLSKFNALSPLAVLERGYSICRKLDGSIVKQASDVQIGHRVRVTLSKGELNCQINNVLSARESDGQSGISARLEGSRKIRREKADSQSDQPSLLFGSDGQQDE